MAERVTRTMDCPGCGKPATVVLTVQRADADGVQRVTIETFSCSAHHFATEATVLRALGYA